MRIRLIAVGAVAIGAMLSAAACDNSVQTRLNGLADNLAGTGVSDTTLRHAGLHLKDPLSCKTVPDSKHHGLMSLQCTTTTKDGKPVIVSGTVSSATNNAQGKGVTRGHFTVTVAGREFLRTNCLGQCQ